MGQEDTVLAGLPEPGEPIFYPRVGHCIYRGVTEDQVAPGTKLLELEDMEEGSRILIPLGRVPQLNLRPAGVALEVIQEVLSAEFEPPIEDEEERRRQIEELITDGTPEALARALKRLHLLRQTEGLDREEEQMRKKIRSWLAAEVSIARDCTRAESQAFMTRILQEAVATHEKKEKEEAKERRRAARELKKAEEAAAIEEAAAAEAAAVEAARPVEVAPPVEEAGPPEQAPPVEEAASEAASTEPTEPEPREAVAPKATDGDEAPAGSGTEQAERDRPVSS